MRQVVLESHSARGGRSWRFSDPVEEVVAHTPGEVIAALTRVERLVAEGLHAAGFVSYEAAAGFDPSLPIRIKQDFPLVWFMVYRRRQSFTPFAGTGTTRSGSGYRLSPAGYSLSREAYGEAIASIKSYIASGDTYQVNFTLRRRFQFTGDPLSLYGDLCRSQRTEYGAFADLGRHCVVSASPELFFSLRNGILTTCPMKGTTRRGRWGAEDERLAEELRRDPKERAENLMIVDLLRNDMGIVSGTGSVRVRSLFDLELLETVHQMTSTIESRLKPEVGLTDLFRALFPCGSVTGAPKKRTMEIIAELEDSPRGLYTGCIGYISPGPEAVFSVAIRTLVVDRETGTAEMGLGSGVTWDSNPESEYRECLAKGRFAERALPDFRLLETLLFEEGAGFFLLDRHLARLSRSASYFCFQLDTVAVGKVLDLRAARLKGAQKVRILVSRSGAFSIESEAIAASDPDAAAVAAFTETTVESADPLLYHKTDNRSFYTAELSKRPDCDEVILCNERGEVTEGTYSNIVARIDGELITPPLEAGLLPGVFREELLETGKISEKSITRKELECAEEIWLINSVRKWRRARLVR